MDTRTLSRSGLKVGAFSRGAMERGCKAVWEDVQPGGVVSA